MQILKDTYKKNGAIHHGYAFQGEKTLIVPALIAFLKKDFAIETKNNPDFSYQEFETFTIDDGRALQAQHIHKALSGKKIFIIATRFITIEAQNGLLKIFEEPSAGTHFFLIMPSTHILLPTLRSRLVIVEETQQDKKNLAVASTESSAFAKKFLSKSPAERLLLIKDLVEEKDKGKAINFVTELEKILAPKLADTDQKTAASLEQILLVKKYLHDRAPSVKLLLEHLAITTT